MKDNEQIECELTHKDIGALIKHIRTNVLNLDVIKFADAIGLSQHTLVAYEDKASFAKPGISVLNKIANEYDLSVKLIVCKKEIKN